MKFKGFLIVLLDVAIGIIKPLLWISLIAFVGKNQIENEYESSIKMGFIENAIERRTEELNNLNLFVNVFTWVVIIFAIIMGVLMLILMKNKIIIPAGILSILFLSIIGGVLILTVYRKGVKKNEPVKPEAPKPQEAKKIVDVDNVCPYCDQRIDKNASVCPYCGGQRNKTIRMI